MAQMRGLMLISLAVGCSTWGQFLTVEGLAVIVVWSQESIVVASVEDFSRKDVLFEFLSSWLYYSFLPNVDGIICDCLSDGCRGLGMAMKIFSRKLKEARR
jgi:hypothetical protein